MGVPAVPLPKTVGLYVPVVKDVISVPLAIVIPEMEGAEDQTGKVDVPALVRIEPEATEAMFWTAPVAVVPLVISADVFANVPTPVPPLATTIVVPVQVPVAIVPSVVMEVCPT